MWLGSDRWGDTLVKELISELRDEARFLESKLRVIRGELRTAFKFIRNDFMHNFVGKTRSSVKACYSGWFESR